MSSPSLYRISKYFKHNIIAIYMYVNKTSPYSTVIVTVIDVLVN